MTSQSKDITLLVTSFVYVKKNASHFQKGTNIYIWNLGETYYTVYVQYGSMYYVYSPR